IWTNRRLVLYLIFVFVLTLCCTGFRLAMTTVIVMKADGTYALLNVTPWVSVVSGTLSVVMSLTTCITCLTLELRTLLTYRRMGAQRQWKHLEDYRLL
ncbi:hypothetical protein AAVH_21327, partial [Aphelenchoides avenae]